MSHRQQVITLHGEGLSQREIGRRLGVSQPAVRKHLLRSGLLVPPQRPEPSTAEAAPSQGEQEASTAAPPATDPSPLVMAPAGAWHEAPLDTVLIAAFQHGLRVVQRRNGICLETPPDFPPTLSEALEQHERELLFEINRSALRHPPCPACGNCLLFRRREQILCPVCQGKLLGPDWVWARW